MLRERERVYLREVIEQINELFGEGTTDSDKLPYMFHVLPGKLPESATLRPQAAGNTEQQFNGSPDLDRKIENA